MAVTFRRSSKGTTIRASGMDAWRLLDALASCGAEPKQPEGAADAQERVPNDSKAAGRTSTGAQAENAAIAPPLKGA